MLAGTKIIAEAWDAAGLYEVTTFVGDRWAVWNGAYRDVVRPFVKGNAGMAGAFADCLMGSSRLFQQPDRDPLRSINFVTAHDGFTLNDLVSYNAKQPTARETATARTATTAGRSGTSWWRCSCPRAGP